MALREMSRQYQYDYELLEKHIKTLELDHLESVRLEWQVVHLKAALLDVHRTIKNIEDRLKIITDANQQI